jgi:hypothetical protein
VSLATSRCFTKAEDVAGASFKSNVVYFAWWLAFGAIALVSAGVLHTLLGITSWPLLEVALGLAFLISLMVLRRFGRTLLESVLIATVSLAVVAGLFALYAHQVSNNLN